MVEIRVKSPSDCSNSELEIYEALVKKGGEVIPDGLRDRIESAHKLVFLFAEQNSLAGIAALKNPSINHKRNIFMKANSEENPDVYLFEIGWIFIEEKFRRKGYSKLLIEELLKITTTTKIFATTRENNEYMKRTNIRCGFVQSGSSFLSERGEHRLILFTN